MVRPILLTTCALVVLGALVGGPALGAEPARVGACRDGATRLCLLGRFEVEAAWSDRGGRERAATALPLSANGGAFSFFESSGADLLVQVDDGRLRNGHFGVRLGALTDAAFTLHVLDTSSGAEWSYDNARGRFAAWNEPFALSPSGAPAERSQASTQTPEPRAETAVVADLLENRAGDGTMDTLAVGEQACRASATDLCLLGGRFRVRALFGQGNRRGVARPAGVAGEAGFFSLDDPERVDLGVRMIDGRTVNGSFWLITSGLGTTDAWLEVSDLASGRTRRFLLPGGSPTSRPEIEAFSASAASVQVTLDTSRAETRTIGPLGGSIQLTDAQGTKFLLVFPVQALDTMTEVKVTPVTAIGGLPFSGGLKAGVRIEPEGLIPAASVLLTITPAAPVALNQQLTFSFRGLTGELYLSPPKAGQAAIVVPVHRLGGYGLGAGTAADLAAQLLRLPSHEEDRLAQRLAGLLLPLRRAGTALASTNAAAPLALPATVLQLLQSEFTTRIAPKLSLIQQGAVLTYLPVSRNFTDSVQDTGLTASVMGARLDPSLEMADRARRPSALDRVAAAEVAGAKKNLADALAACKGPKGAAAAVKAYNNYSVLRSHRKQTAKDTAKLRNCVSFELDFRTDVSVAGTNTFQHDTVPPRPAGPAANPPPALHLPLSLDLAKGFFSADVAAPQTASLTPSQSSGCSAKESSRSVAHLKVDQLLINSLGQYDDGEELAALGMVANVFYKIAPASMVKWIITCPSLGAQPYSTSWSAIYDTLHFDEMNFDYGSLALLSDIHMILGASEDPLKFAEKAYENGMANVMSETTFFYLLHTPK